MSEYYARGRAVFADATSLAFFVIGFLGAGPFAWPGLRASFEAGAYDRGLAVFIVRLFGSGVAAGLTGYVLGSLAGRLWQAYHQWRRARRAPRAAEALTQLTAVPVPVPKEGTSVPRHAPTAMSCRAGSLSSSSYAILAQRLAADANDRRYVESRTTEIVTLAAWDGLEIAGVARLLSDGHGVHFITDFAVDPHYVASDVEATLIDFAWQRVPPGGKLTRV